MNRDFEDAWVIIQEMGIDALVNFLDNRLKNKLMAIDSQTFSQIYGKVHNMCNRVDPLTQHLYQKHGETINTYLETTVLPALKLRKGQDGTSLLQELRFRWENHKIMNRWLGKLLSYLDRYYITHNNATPLLEVGLKLFKANIYDVIKCDTTSAIISLINQEREGQIIDKTLLKATVNSYESITKNLESYTLDLETPLLAETKKYYSSKKASWIVTDSTPTYLIKAETCLEAETKRVRDYLNPSSNEKLLNVFKEKILKDAHSELIYKEASGCCALLENDKSDDLKRMFRLFSLIEDGTHEMAKIVETFISEKGKEIIDQRKARLDDGQKHGQKDKNDDQIFIKALIELRKKYHKVITETFSADALFHKALKLAFVGFVNKSVGKFSNAELLSNYCDHILKSGGEKLNEAEVDERLDQVVELCTYLTDKDMFAEIYRNQMSKRLLNQRSASDDAEKSMVMKLKVQFGAQFTAKMEGMLNDLAVSADQKKEFDKKIEDQNAKIDFSAQVLTTGFWPTYKIADIALPSNLTECIRIFKEWHDQKYSQRKLSWVHTLGNSTVRATFGRKTYDLLVSTLQAVALMSLNGGQSMTFLDLTEKLNLDEAIMKPLMHSLSCGKYKVVKKSPSGNKINNTDTFVANSRFSSNMRKIRIPMASLDASHNAKRVEEDRSAAIEASIIRIMKARKTMKHKDLIAGVLTQLAFFKPNPRTIKKRIESLIEREYLQRDPDNQNLYKYLA